MASISSKKAKGQFYTVNSEYIMRGLSIPEGPLSIIEPFAGKGDLISWIKRQDTAIQTPDISVEAYDIDPKNEGILVRDTLMDPPTYADKWILTNPPYLARNKCDSKIVFDKYDTNDLYKCFIMSLVEQPVSARGGILIIPVGFFLSPRDIDVRCRSTFLSKYQITRVNYFEEDVFPDTTTTVVAFSFERASTILDSQSIEWTMMPAGKCQTFILSAANDWIIGGDIYNLPVNNTIKVRRYVDGQILKPGEQLTELTLTALDSGLANGRICLEYRPGYTYLAKDTSRSYATLCITGCVLTPEKQQQIAEQFNQLIEKKREETWSLFLPQFRESKEYARKRIPFELAYRIVSHLYR